MAHSVKLEIIEFTVTPLDQMAAGNTGWFNNLLADAIGYFPSIWDGYTTNGIKRGGTHDQSDYIIADSIEINDRIELEEVFTLYSSTASFRLLTNSYLSSILSHGNLRNEGNLYSVKITIDDIPQFYGVLNKESIVYHPTEGAYDVECVGWYKYLYEFYKHIRIPKLSTNNYKINKFLELIGQPVAFSQNISVGNLSLFFRQNYYLNLRNHLGLQTTISKMLDEIQKHYIAYIDIMPDETLVCLNRSEFLSDDPLDITNYVIDGSKEIQPYSKAKYNKLFTNIHVPAEAETQVEERPEPAHDTWVIMWRDGSVDRYEYVVTVPEGDDILDLRQQVYINNDQFDYGLHSNLLWNGTQLPDNAEDLYALGRSFLAPIKKINVSVNTLNVFKFQAVSIDGDVYQVVSTDKNIEKTDLELHYVRPLYPGPFD